MASMAKPEAPRSSPSNGLADSYIGSLISLTSKSDIRYEGLFYNISTEESTIGLTNVRSFGTEGRKQDGPQVGPSDKVYEYILFRASDIKDLKVISSPPVQPPSTPPVFNDPAIIQTHHPQAANPTASVGGPIPDPQTGLATSTFQPVGNLGPWAPPPSPYYPGYYRPSNGFQPQQQPFLSPPLNLSMPSPMQQTQHFLPPSPMQQPQTLLTPPPPPGLVIPSTAQQTSHYASGPSGISALDLSQSPSALLPVPNFQLSVLPAQSTSLNSGPITLHPQMQQTNMALPKSAANLNVSPSALLPIPSFQSSVLPPQSSPLNLPTSSSQPSAVVSESSTYLATSWAPAQPSPLGTPLNEPAIQPQISDNTSIAGTSSSISNEGAMPSLVTPGQLLQQPPHKDSEATRGSLLPLPQNSQTPSQLPGLLSSNVAPELQAPLLPLPTQSEYKSHATHRNPQPRNNYRGGSQRGRGNMMSRPVNRFTEEFDFTAMNEKFNKDEVWGDIGKSMKAQEDGSESQDDDDNDGLSKPESNPVYVKDDFFDSLSCNSLDHGSQNGRPNFSQQRRRDTETFGFVPRQNRGGGRGGYGQGRGGYGQGRGGGYGQGRGGGYGQGGGYYGRGGNGFVERGRGGNFPGRGS